MHQYLGVYWWNDFTLGIYIKTMHWDVGVYWWQIICQDFMSVLVVSQQVKSKETENISKIITKKRKQRETQRFCGEQGALYSPILLDNIYKDPFPTSTLMVMIHKKNQISLNNERLNMIQSTINQKLVYS